MKIEVSIIKDGTERVIEDVTDVRTDPLGTRVVSDAGQHYYPADECDEIFIRRVTQDTRQKSLLMEETNASR
jgi:hypothetical protein